MKSEPKIGDKFGDNMLTVINIPLMKEYKNRARLVVLCRCSCGKQKEIIVSNLTSGLTKSCGCMARQGARQRFGDVIAARMAKVKRLTIFNETKTLTEWSNDQRCQVSRRVLSKRLAKGVAVDSNILTKRKRED